MELGLLSLSARLVSWMLLGSEAPRDESPHMGAEWSLWSWCFQYLHQLLGADICGTLCAAGCDIVWFTEQTWFRIWATWDMPKGPLGPLGPRAQVMAMYFTLEKRDQCAWKWWNTTCTVYQYTSLNCYFAGENRRILQCDPQIHSHFFMNSAGWSSSKVLNFMTTLKSHMNTTTLSKEVSLA